MKTEKQKELVNSFLSSLSEESEPLYAELILYLSELGYNPKKERSNMSFKHDLHNKQMAKIGMTKSKEPHPFFALRFSACRGYSQRFDDVVREAIVKYPSKVPGCLSNDCNYCAGEPAAHVYTCKTQDGERKSHCGAYSLEIPNITADDVAEIKKLIQEEHDYLLKHEANA